MNLARLLMIDLSGPSLTADERAFLTERRPGGVCLFGRNVVDNNQVADLVAELRSLAGPELLVAVDQEGGGVVRLPELPFPPSAMALGAADDPDLTFAVAAATARGLRAVGINVDFAPVADVNSNPLNPVIADRSFGSEPTHVARHVTAFVRGMQSEGVAATVKHFPGHGDVALDSHLELPVLERSSEMLDRLELPPFRAAVEAGVAAVMTAHIVLSNLDPTLPATLSQAVLARLLRGHEAGELGFDGVVFTDALDMKAVADRWIAPKAASMAVAAGADMPVHVGSIRDHEEIVIGLERDLREGRLDRARLEASAARLDRLSRSFPARPETGGAWGPNDETLLGEAARRSLVSLGRLPELVAGSRVLLVAAGAVRQGAASQATVRPAEGLATALRERGVVVTELQYPPERPLEMSSAAAAAARGHHFVLFASTARTAMAPDEVELARLLARPLTQPSSQPVAQPSTRPSTQPLEAARFVHVALWNPYSTAELPGPALVTFGWRSHSMRAAAAALTGQPVTGRAPIPLRTFDDIEL